MNHASLFSGIGGFDLAAQWVGWNNLLHVEKDDFCRRVLNHHFPNSKSYADIKQFSGYPWAGRVDVLSGGFPCQPYSAAGKRKGSADDRHLWPEMLRVIREIRPTWVVAENVRGLVTWNSGAVFDEVCSSLEDEGYEVFPTLLPAASVNAPHKRDRIWIVAYSHRNGSLRAPGQDVGTQPQGRVPEWHEVCLAVESSRLRGFPTDPDSLGWNRWWRKETERRTGDTGQGVQPEAEGPSQGGDAPDTDGQVLERGHGEGATGGAAVPPIRTQPLSVAGGWETFPTQPPLCGGDDGLPTQLDGVSFPKWRRESVKAYGNAIVPQVAYHIFKCINQYG